LLLAGSYLVGAIPGGLLVGLLMGRNLLKLGSGKTGTANSMSVLGRPAATAVFALDLLKGLVVVVLAWLLSWPNEVWLDLAIGGAGAAAIVGHNWSLWVRLFTGRWGGGRGIVTAIGAMLTVQPLAVAAAVIFGALAFIISRHVVLATIVGVAATILTSVILVLSQQLPPWLLPGTISWGLLIVAGFHDSIGRLLKMHHER
jgi:glycerol-3-phosphate acyltransferase PlsY